MRRVRLIYLLVRELVRAGTWIRTEIWWLVAAIIVLDSDWLDHVSHGGALQVHVIAVARSANVAKRLTL